MLIKNKKIMVVLFTFLVGLLFLSIFNMQTAEASVIFSSGFESGTFSDFTGQYAGSGTSTVASDQKHSGTYAGKFTVTANGGYADTYKTLASSYATVFDEFYVRFSALPASGKSLILGFVTNSGASNEPIAGVGLGYYNGAAHWKMSYQKAGVYTTIYSSSTPSVNTWYKIGLAVNVSGNQGTVETYINDVKDLGLSDTSNFDNNNLGNVNRLFYGVDWHTESTYPVSVWVDDITVQDSKPSQNIFGSGFESGSFSDFTGQWQGSGTSSVVSDVKHSGSYAGRFTVTAIDGYADTYKTLASSYANVYDEFYVRFSALPTSGRSIILGFVTNTGASNEPIAGVGLGYYNGAAHWKMSYQKAGVYTTIYSSSTPSVNTWYKVGLAVNVSGTLGTVEVYINDVKDSGLSDTSHFDNNDLGTVNRLFYGVDRETESSYPVSVWIDDITVQEKTGSSAVYYNLAISVSGSGSTNPAVGSHQYASGSSVNIYASPNTGWFFYYWLLNGTNVGSANPYTLNINANYNLTAVFSVNPIIPFTFTPLLVNDSFSSDIGIWSAIQGGYQIQNDQLTTSSGTNNDLIRLTSYYRTDDVHTLARFRTITAGSSNWHTARVVAKLAIDGAGARQEVYGIIEKDGTVELTIQDGYGGAHFHTASSNLSPYDWHVMEISIDDKVGKLWVDGVKYVDCTDEWFTSLFQDKAQYIELYNDGDSVASFDYITVENHGDDNYLKEVGGFWMEDYPSNDLSWTSEEVEGFYNRLGDYGWTKVFCYGNDPSAQEKYLEMSSVGGTDYSYIDSVDFAYFSGHGSPSGPYFGWDRDGDGYLTGQVHYNETSWGDGGYGDLEWFVGSCCQMLQYNYGSKDVIDRWGPTFHGLHAIMSFSTVSYDLRLFVWNPGTAYVNYMVGYWPNPAYTIGNSWERMTCQWQPDDVFGAELGVYDSTTGYIGYNDYLPGYGNTGYDINNPQDFRWEEWQCG